ncbi:serine/threonine-protein kinase [Actinoplanes sp. NBRC 101535]|uniref:serine/threonine protein kinase n=1 Tax=Actinoplanes sp. NBRC 101535 TaxID=3032196 RepID=UPI0024A4809D|nr:serine/threonine-protein kinase [Actinoplanes sp. NBRC 101535]GLY06830.1 hypothetical protein Acsp01_72090 [Actinoplanes sp. NBRC 101535]
MTTALQPGDPRRLGRYEIVARIGAGGMGSVFLGRAPGGRQVAIKVIRPEFAGEDEFRGRFRSEVARARQVPPFCTAEVLDADPEHATPYLVVEYVDGPDLADVVKGNGPLAGGALHSVAVGVATALAAIHGAGVVHRDLKPRNVLFALGSPKVIDFGIAQAVEATSRHTRTDMMVGTLAYMAPERFDPETDHLVGPPSDVFAWGAVVTYAGTGRTPFAGDSPTMTAARILTQPPNLTGLPPALADLVALTLAKDPADRPTAHELLDLLLATRTGDVFEGAPPTDLAPGLRRAAEAAQHTGRYRTDPGVPGAPKRRWPKLIIGTAVATVLAAAAGAGLALTGRDDATPVSMESAAPAVPVPSAATPVIRGPAVIDSLARQGQWYDGAFDNGACEVEGRLTATVKSGRIWCPGPQTAFGGDQTVAVDVTLTRAGSCALIWLRYDEPNGYRLELCPGTASFGIDFEGTVTTLASEKSDVLVTGERMPVAVVVEGSTTTVTVDGTPVLTGPMTEPAFAAGRVMLGVASSAKAAATVTFADAELRSVSADSSAAGFPDLTEPDVEATALIRNIYDTVHSVTLESVIVRGSGAKRTVEGSRTMVTLELPESAKFFAPEKDGKGCFDAKTDVATCPVQEESFEGWLNRQSGPAPVQVRIRNGKVVRMAALDMS